MCVLPQHAYQEQGGMQIQGGRTLKGLAGLSVSEASMEGEAPEPIACRWGRSSRKVLPVHPPIDSEGIAAS